MKPSAKAEIERVQELVKQAMRLSEDADELRAKSEELHSKAEKIHQRITAKPNRPLPVLSGVWRLGLMVVRVPAQEEI